MEDVLSALPERVSSRWRSDLVRLLADRIFVLSIRTWRPIQRIFCSTACSLSLVTRPRVGAPPVPACARLKHELSPDFPFFTSLPRPPPPPLRPPSRPRPRPPRPPPPPPPPPSSPTSSASSASSSSLPPPLLLLPSSSPPPPLLPPPLLRLVPVTGAPTIESASARGIGEPWRPGGVCEATSERCGRF